MMNNTKFVSGKDQKKQINACVDGPRNPIKVMTFVCLFACLFVCLFA